jgi:hypothetical protein
MQFSNLEDIWIKSEEIIENFDKKKNKKIKYEDTNVETESSNIDTSIDTSVEEVKRYRRILKEINKCKYCRRKFNMMRRNKFLNIIDLNNPNDQIIFILIIIILIILINLVLHR